MAEQEIISAVVCVPTFRRPDWLLKTLSSLVEQQTGFGYAIVVVDNDGDDPRGAHAARDFLASSNIAHAIFVEEKQGNCHAINRAFGEAQKAFPDAGHFLMIDDDEVAHPDWLREMVGLAEAKGADIVGGPVYRLFEGKAPDGVRKHQLFISINGPTRQIDQLHGSGNCLIRSAVFDRLGTPYFDLKFNFLGGGDLEFFTRCRKAGFTTWWCADAEVNEFVPADRLTARFLMTRSIRTGSINYLVDRKNGLPAAAALLKNVVSLGLSVGRSLAVLMRTGHPVPASHPFLVSIGRFYAAFGFLPTPYKASRKT